MRPDDVHLKVEWAYKHIEELHSALDAFINSDPYSVSVKTNPETGHHIYYVSKISDVSPDILLLAGDILQILRSALDYLVYALVIANNGTPTKQTGFPIFDNFPLTPDQQTAFAGKIKGMRDDAKSMIQSLDPYKGRNNPLWRLHALNIIDKHRFILTGGVTTWEFNVGQHLTEIGIASPTTNSTDVWVKPLNPQPIELGQELLIDSPDMKVNKNIQFKFHVAFNEPGICVGEPMILVLRQSLNVVRNIVEKFAGYF